MSETVESPPTWAIVHLLGHVRYAGRLTEEEKFGGKIGRVDVPDDAGFTTVYFGGASVYKIEVVSEAVARVAARSHGSNAPVSPWDFPKQLPAAEPVPEDRGLNDGDRVYRCGHTPEDAVFTAVDTTKRNRRAHANCA